MPTSLIWINQAAFLPRFLPNAGGPTPGEPAPMLPRGGCKSHQAEAGQPTSIDGWIEIHGDAFREPGQRGRPTTS